MQGASQGAENLTGSPAVGAIVSGVGQAAPLALGLKGEGVAPEIAGRSLADKVIDANAAAGDPAALGDKKATAFLQEQGVPTDTTATADAT